MDEEEPQPRSASFVDASYDLAECPPVRRVVVVASQFRTGSTLVARALRDTGRMGVPDEYFLPLRIQEFRQRLGIPRPSWRGLLGRTRRRLEGNPNWRWTEHFTQRSFTAYMGRIAALRTTPNGVLGLKVQASQLPVLRNVGVDLDWWGPTPEFIALDRLDRIDQVVSHHRTKQDRVFSSEQVRDPTVSLRYEERTMRDELVRFERGAQAWARYFDERAIDPLRITYEDLDGDYPSTMRSVFDHLGMTDLEVGDPPLSRLRDDVNAEWAERLRASLRADPIDP